MSRNSEIILPINTHVGDSSVQTVIGERYKADGYYNRTDGFHTVQYNLTNLVGSVYIQATLATTPSDEDWFTVPSTIHTSNSEESTDASGSFMYNFSGNYVWVRATISNWSSGTLKSVLFNH